MNRIGAVRLDGACAAAGTADQWSNHVTIEGGKDHAGTVAPNEEGVIVYHLHVAPDDTGRVIGKQGRIAKAIRVIMRSGAAKYNQKIAVEID